MNKWMKFIILIILFHLILPNIQRCLNAFNIIPIETHVFIIFSISFCFLGPIWLFFLFAFFDPIWSVSEYLFYLFYLFSSFDLILLFNLFILNLFLNHLSKSSLLQLFLSNLLYKKKFVLSFLSDFLLD